MTIERFSINIPYATIEDLSERLARSRFTSPTDKSWKAGTDPEYLRELVSYWLSAFDWRARERELNAFPQFTTSLNGSRVHFVHLRATGQNVVPMPLVLTHGWPSCFLEFLPLARMLTDPVSHGADPTDAFDVIIPSLPGFLFSDLPADGIVTPPQVANLWKSLITDKLGYRRFGAYGGDLGSHVTDFLGAMHSDQVLGIYTHHPNLSPDLPKEPALTPAEEAYLANRAAGPQDGKAYAAIQSTRPDTLAAGLIDSPVGLLAWIVEKYREWSDCDGNVENRFNRDTLLSIVMLYWFTGCIGSSFRSYYCDNLVPPLPPVKVPAGFTVTNEDQGYPLEFASRTYIDIRQWRVTSQGRHFFALEEPERLVSDLRDFFRPLRQSLV
jgi:pimeloyl-ACP methyl ester carboxylesterase